MLLLDDTINAVAASETAAEVVEKGAASQSYWDLAIQGGWIMIVLAVLSVLAIYIFIDKYLAVKKAGKNQDGFMQNIKNYIKESKKRKQQIEDALDKAGIDRNDEKAVELFRMKEEMRLDYIEEYESNKAKYKKELEKAKERALKQARKEMKKNEK